MAGDRVPVQLGDVDRSKQRRLTISEPLARMAYREYERQYGESQSFERLHERGGFGVEELMTLLCQRIVFLEALIDEDLTFNEARQKARRWPMHEDGER